jgi:hypothetical protein
MFCDGVLTPGSRAAPAAPEQTASTSTVVRMRVTGLAPFSTFQEMAAHEILVWSDYI